MKWKVCVFLTSSRVWTRVVRAVEAFVFQCFMSCLENAVIGTTANRLSLQMSTTLRNSGRSRPCVSLAEQVEKKDFLAFKVGKNTPPADKPLCKGKGEAMRWRSIFMRRSGMLLTVCS